jgi:hypothetical protein
VLTSPIISVPSPLRFFSAETARRNAAHAISVTARRRAERDELEQLLADLEAEQHRNAG